MNADGARSTWHMEVSTDGRSVTVRGPGSLAVTSLGDTIATLTVMDSVRLDTSMTDRPPDWTVDLAEEILREAQPIGSVFLRALVDRGGTATVEDLRDATGMRTMQHATLTLSTTARRVLGKRQPGTTGGRRFVEARPHLDQPRGPVYDYRLAAELVPIFEEALDRLGR